MKSRGMYETPGGKSAAPIAASRSITLDRGAAHLKDELMPKYAELIYNGFWFSPEREMLQAAIDHSKPRSTARCASSSTRAAPMSWAASRPFALLRTPRDV
jgi:argininosuccinate synthase